MDSESKMPGYRRHDLPSPTVEWKLDCMLGNSIERKRPPSRASLNRFKVNMLPPDLKGPTLLRLRN